MTDGVRKSRLVKHHHASLFLSLVSVAGGRYEKDTFASEGLLLQKASRLGIGTNNCAEALGMASAITIFLRFVYWVLQQLSHLALHPMT